MISMEILIMSLVHDFLTGSLWAEGHCIILRPVLAIAHNVQKPGGTLRYH